MDAKEITGKKALALRPLLFCLLLAMCLTLGGEILSRRSVGKVIAYVIARPHAFLYNVLIVALTLSPALLFKRRIFFYTVVSVLWATVHVVDMITDCDTDTLLYLCHPDGPTCHTGRRSCFFNPILEEDTK